MAWTACLGQRHADRPAPATHRRLRCGSESTDDATYNLSASAICSGSRNDDGSNHGHSGSDGCAIEYAKYPNEYT
jgi:hypothetical protein